MITVPVGGFHDYVISLRDVFGILDEGLGCISYIAGKDDLFLIAVFRKPEFYRGGTEKMSRVNESAGKPFGDLKPLMIRNRVKELQHILGILGRIHGLNL